MSVDDFNPFIAKPERENAGEDLEAGHLLPQRS
jgi:hypothetical protein